MREFGTADLIATVIAFVIVGYISIRIGLFFSKLSKHVNRHLDDDAGRQTPK